MSRPLDLKALIESIPSEGEPPLIVPDGPAQDEALDTLLAEIKLDCPHSHLSRWNNRRVLEVQVEIPREESYRGYRSATSLHVSFAGEQLQVSTGYSLEGAPLPGIASLRSLAATVRERLIEQRRREQKREKIRKLKERAIETQIEGLASRMSFAYRLNPMHTKVKLAVRLDERNALFVDIPHSGIQDKLAELEKLIENVRQLYGCGVRFKISGSDGRGFREPRPA